MSEVVSNNNKSYVIKTLSISKSADNTFEKLFDKIVKYADRHHLKRPKKSELFAKIVEGSSLKPEDYYS